MECRFQPLKSKSISFPFCSASFEVIHPSIPPPASSVARRCRWPAGVVLVLVISFADASACRPLSSVLINLRPSSSPLSRSLVSCLPWSLPLTPVAVSLLPAENTPACPVSRLRAACQTCRLLTLDARSPLGDSLRLFTTSRPPRTPSIPWAIFCIPSESWLWFLRVVRLFVVRFRACPSPPVHPLCILVAACIDLACEHTRKKHIALQISIPRFALKIQRCRYPG
jgi:hypothetical protein